MNEFNGCRLIIALMGDFPLMRGEWCHISEDGELIFEPYWDYGGKYVNKEDFLKLTFQSIIDRFRFNITPEEVYEEYKKLFNL